MSQPSNNPTDLYQSFLKPSVEMMNICFHGVERLQNYQAEALNEFRSAQAEMSKQLNSIRRIDDLHESQANLMRNQMVRMTAYWNGLYAAATQNRMELLKGMQTMTKELTEDIKLKLDVAPTASEPAFVSALKLVVGAAQSTYAATVRASEEMVRLSTAQIEAANGSATTAARQTKTKRAA